MSSFGTRGKAAAAGIALVLILALIGLWPRHTAPVQKPGTDADCKRQLEALRAKIRAYVAKNHRPPRELFDPRKTIGVPKEYRCPVDGRNYSYNPTRWPTQWVICTRPEHRDY